MGFLLAMAAGAALAAGDPAIGRWATETQHGVVEIYACGSSICGRLQTSDGLRANPDLRDTHNSDTSKRNRPLKNLEMLWGFHRDGKTWAGGLIYNGDDGGTYHATITPAGPDTLKLRGCIVWPLCKTQTWHRLP